MTGAANKPISLAYCRLCGAPIPVKRRRGSPTAHCSTKHKDLHWKAQRGYGPALFAAGRLIIELLDDGQVSVHALSERPDLDRAT